MTTKMQTRLEVTGYVFLTAAAGLLGYVLAGPVLAAGLVLLVAGAVLVFLGNV